MNNIRNKNFKELIYSILLYLIGVILANIIMDIQMDWTTFLVYLLAFGFGHFIRVN